MIDEAPPKDVSSSQRRLKKATQENRLGTALRRNLLKRKQAGSSSKETASSKKAAEGE